MVKNAAKKRTYDAYMSEMRSKVALLKHVLTAVGEQIVLCEKYASRALSRQDIKEARLLYEAFYSAGQALRYMIQDSTQRIDSARERHTKRRKKDE